MSVIAKRDRQLSRRRLRALCALTIYVLFAFLAVTSGPAWSFEVTEADSHGQTNVSVPVTSSPAGVGADACLYILRAAREKTESATTERRYRQAAGSAAALGLVFGVRFALGPREIMKSQRRAQPIASLRIWEAREESTGGGEALAIADYRACRHEQALRSLTD